MHADAFEQEVHACLEGVAAPEVEERVLARAAADPASALRLNEFCQMHAALQAAHHDADAFAGRARDAIARKGRSGAFAARVRGKLAASRSERGNGARRRPGRRDTRPRAGNASALRWLLPLAAAAGFLVVAVQYMRPGPDPEPVRTLAAEVTSARGHAVLAKADGSSRPLAVGTVLAPGSRVRTGGESAVELEYLDGTRVDLVADTDLRLRAGIAAKELRLLHGEIVMHVARQQHVTPLRVHTVHASVTVLGTDFTVRVLPDRTHLAVEKGRVRFTRLSDDATIDLPAGRCADAGAGVPFVARAIGAALEAEEDAVRETAVARDETPAPLVPRIEPQPVPEPRFREPRVDDFLTGEHRTPVCRLPYRLFVPPEYDRTIKYPLVLFMHGIGERGTDNRRQLNNRAGGAFAFITPSRQEKAPCFFLAPQLDAKLHWTGANVLDCIHGLLLSLEQDYSIDPGRLYVTGLSTGGFGTWALIVRRPGVFAAAVPISGGMGGLENRPIPPELRTVAVWAFHGAKDPTVPVANSRNAVAALRKAGCEPRYTEFADAEHGVWPRVYGDAAVIDWVFSQRRGQPPRQ